jgi:hypothetical protein
MRWAQTARETRAKFLQRDAAVEDQLRHNAGLQASPLRPGPLALTGTCAGPSCYS